MCRILTLIISIFMAVASLAHAAPAASTPPKLRVLAVGGLTADQRTAMLIGFNRAFLGLRPGDGLLVYDAVARAIVMKFEVPNEPRFALANYRQRHFQAAYQHVRKHLEKDGVGATALVVDLLAELSKHVPTEAQGRLVDVLITADALHHDDREPGFSWRGGTYPSDGLIAGDENRSPFGMANRRGTLTGADVYFCHTDTREHWGTTLHEDQVERAWSLIIGELGSTLAHWTHDLTRCVNTWMDGTATPPRLFTLDRTAKPQMLRTPPRVAPVGMGGTLTAHTPTQGGDAFLRDNVKLTRRPPPSPVCQVTRIGIRWAAPVDIDLYARNSPSNPYLSFRETKTVEGVYVYDHQTSPDAGQTLEYIEFTKPFDLRHGDVWLNYYAKPTQPGPKGEVRVFCDDRIYGGTPFEFSVTNGNQAAGFNPAGGMTGPHWLRVDVARVVGLGVRRAQR